VIRMGPPLTLTEDEARAALGVLTGAIRAAETL
jgi:4-aminobutyrate aminotransferase-like enzyme